MPIIIQTERADVLLRQLALEDSPDLFDLIDQNRTHLSQHGDMTAEKYPDIDAVVCSIVCNPNPDRLRFGIWRSETLLGTANLTPNDLASYGYLGYWIGSAYTRQGIASTATRALVAYAFESLYWTEVVAEAHRDNEGSKKVLRRCGFDLVRTKDDILVFRLPRKR